MPDQQTKRNKLTKGGVHRLTDAEALIVARIFRNAEQRRRNREQPEKEDDHEARRS